MKIGELKSALILLGLDRLLPALVAGRDPKHWICRLIPDNTLYRAGTRRTVKRNGLMFDLDLNDHMQWLVYFGHDIENRTSLYDLAASGMTVIDVGSNIGETALNLANLVGDKGHVIAIEANPENFENLSKNIKLNSIKNINALCLGLSEKRGIMYVKRRVSTNKGADQLTTDSGSNGSKVNVTSMNFLVEELGLKKVDLVKIDVEGMELLVLKGANQVLKEKRPILFLEYSNDNFSGFGYEGRELLIYLKDLNYRLLDARTKLDFPDDENNIHTDIIAIPQ